MRRLRRLLRVLCAILAVLSMLAWGLTSNGLYFWFNVGAENRLRCEYGRVLWRHVEGGTARTSAGIDGGASQVRWTFAWIRGEGRWLLTVPLWAPVLAFGALVWLLGPGRRRAAPA